MRDRRVLALVDRVALRSLNPVTAALTLLLMVPVLVYRAIVSPLLPPACRFHPSCSVYAVGALQVHGPLKGLWLTGRRLSRCQPFHPGGLDPVPPRRSGEQGTTSAGVMQSDSSSQDTGRCDSAPASVRNPSGPGAGRT